MRALTQYPKLKPSGTVKLLARTDVPLQDPHPVVGPRPREDAFPPLLFPAYRRQFEGAKAIYIPKGESQVAFLWLVACHVLPAAAYRAELSFNPASQGGGAERLVQQWGGMGEHQSPPQEQPRDFHGNLGCQRLEAPRPPASLGQVC